MPKKINKYLQNSEAIYREFSVTPLTLTLVQHGFHDPLLKKYYKQWYLPISVLEFRHGGINWCFSPEFFRQMSHHIVNLIKEDKRMPAVILAQSQKHGRKALSYVKQLHKLLNGRFPRKDVAVLIGKLLREVELVCAYGWIPVTSDVYYFNLSRELEGIIDQYCQREKAPLAAKEYLSVLTTPTQASKTWEYKNALYRAALNGQSKKILEAIVTKFYAVNYGHSGPGLTLKEVAKEVATLSRIKNLKTKYKEFLSERSKVIKNQQLIAKKLKLDPQAQYLVKVARDFIFIKGYRLEVLYQTYAVLDKVLKQILEEGKYQHKLIDLKQLSKFELIRFLKSGDLPPVKLLREREKYMTYTAVGIKRHEIRVGKEAQQYIKSFVVLNKGKETRMSVHGNVACSGKVTGRVKIVNVAKDIAKVNKGDILVATQTTPELLPAMNKAAAFVTDIGGITSHAAIVSREMNKPCVIGTKIATEIFKDGDLVEVDANKGIVRKL